jgi:hypothetical protein
MFIAPFDCPEHVLSVGGLLVIEWHCAKAAVAQTKVRATKLI